jgi:hypothetical protein
MRARRRWSWGWTGVVAYAALLAAVSVAAVGDPSERPEAGPPGSAAVADAFVAAWQRGREATFVTIGTYERHSPVTGASIASEDVVAQRPPRRLHRQLGGIEGRDDDRLLVCPAPPGGVDEREPCRLGPAGGPTYAESVADEVAALRSLVRGPDRLYTVRSGGPGCFELEQVRVDPRVPFGVDASFCFDAATGAPTDHRVRYAGGIQEVVAVRTVRTEVTDADLTP